MIMDTYIFGEIEIKDDDIVTFEHGIPGFEHLRTFAFIRESEEELFTHLQAVEDGDVTFILTSPFLFYPQYDFVLPKSIQDELKLTDEKDVEVWAIVTLGEQLGNTTMNLLAPIVVNKRERLGKQVVIQDGVYKTKHLLIQETVESVDKEG